MLRLNWFFKIAAMKALLKLLRLVQFIFAIVIIIGILRLNAIRSIIHAVDIWRQTNPQLFGVIVGAILISLLGLLNQLLIDHRQRRHALRRSAKLIRVDIDRVLSQVRIIDLTLRSNMFSNSEARAQFLKMSSHSIDWMPNWFEHVTEVGLVLSDEHLSRIHRIYSGAQQIQNCLLDANIEKLKQLVIDLLRNDNSRKLMEDLLPTSEDLLKDLEYVYVKGRSIDPFWIKLWRILRFRRAYKSAKQEVEAEIIKVLSMKTRMDLNDVLKHMNTWISAKGKQFNRRYRGIWDQVVFRVVSDSDQIKMVWNELWLAKSDDIPE